jgi:hypothetical protein
MPVVKPGVPRPALSIDQSAWTPRCALKVLAPLAGREAQRAWDWPGRRRYVVAQSGAAGGQPHGTSSDDDTYQRDGSPGRQAGAWIRGNAMARAKLVGRALCRRSARHHRGPLNEQSSRQRRHLMVRARRLHRHASAVAALLSHSEAIWPGHDIAEFRRRNLACVVRTDAVFRKELRRQLRRKRHSTSALWGLDASNGGCSPGCGPGEARPGPGCLRARGC